MKKYDLVVVGSGVGLTVLGQAINQGWKCALIEDAKMGGTCLTRGCIPSKVLVYPADVIREAQHSPKIGVKMRLEELDWELISERMWSQIDESNQINEGLSSAPNLDIYRGVAEFTSKYEMRVKLNETGKYSDKFKGKRFVLASGGRSFIPPINGLDQIDYITTESFFGEKYPEKPWKSLIIIGGGIIAAEFAHIFSAMGTDVTIVEMLPRLVSTEEPKISQVLEEEFRNSMTVLTNAKAVGARKTNGLNAIDVEFSNGNRNEYRAEAVLVATGRISNADRLHVENSGIALDKKGWILTNEFLETNIENIWAIGDANGKFQFRHKANHDAEVCVRNLFGQGQKTAVDYSAVPWAIFSYPQIAHVGLTEQEAIEKGYRIYVAEKQYSTVAKGFAMGLDTGTESKYFFKLVVSEDYKILGAHAIGPHAAVLIQPFVYLMNAGFTCIPEERQYSKIIPKDLRACPEAGSFMPIYRSQVIHPSLNEVTGWALSNLQPVNIESQGHSHSHSH